FLRVRELEAPAEELDVLADHRHGAPTKEVAPLPPARNQKDLAALAPVAGEIVLGGPDQVRVKSPGKSAVRSNQYEQELLHRPLGEQRMNRLLAPLNPSGAAREPGKHLLDVEAGADAARMRAQPA